MSETKVETLPKNNEFTDCILETCKMGAPFLVQALSVPTPVTSPQHPLSPQLRPLLPPQAMHEGDPVAGASAAFLCLLLPVIFTAL